MIVDVEYLADLFGRTRQTIIQEWVKKYNMPVHTWGQQGSGLKYEFDLKEVIEWRIKSEVERQVGDETSMRPLDLLNLEKWKMAVIERKKVEGTLVDTNQFSMVFFTALKNFKEGLYTIPTRLIEEYGAKFDPLEFHALLDEELQNIYEEIERNKETIFKDN